MTYLPISTTSKKTRPTTSMYSGYSHFQNASKWQADNQFPRHFKCTKGSYSRPAAYYQRGTYCMQNPSCQSCNQRHWRENVLNGKKGEDLAEIQYAAAEIQQHCSPALSKRPDRQDTATWCRKRICWEEPEQKKELWNIYKRGLINPSVKELKALYMLYCRTSVKQIPTEINWCRCPPFTGCLLKRSTKISIIDSYTSYSLDDEIWFFVLFIGIHIVFFASVCTCFYTSIYQLVF